MLSVKRNPYEADAAEYRFSKSELMPGIAANLTLQHLSGNQCLLLDQSYPTDNYEIHFS
jgi:hypothetical protein